MCHIRHCLFKFKELNLKINKNKKQKALKKRVKSEMPYDKEQNLKKITK
jgi:hypothetical protein